MGPVDRSRISQAFDEFEPSLKRLLGEVEYSLQEALGASGIKVHTAKGRVKEKDSFLDKIDRKGYNDPFQQTDDLVGVRVVCLFMDDLGKVGKILSKEFDVLESEDKADNSSYDTFGYMSHHYICTLRPESSGRRYDGLLDIRFEVQCRTLLMDSWANVSHYLYYKGDSSIPQALKRDFHALSGLLHVADRQFQHLYHESRESVEAASAAVEHTGETPDDEVNLSNVLALFEQIYPDRNPSEPDEVSLYIEELAEAGMRSVQELRDVLSRGNSKAERYEEQYPPFGTPGVRFSGVGTARHATASVVQDFQELKYPNGPKLFHN